MELLLEYNEAKNQVDSSITIVRKQQWNKINLEAYMPKFPLTKLCNNTEYSQNNGDETHVCTSLN